MPRARSALVARDERVARFGTGVAHDVPEPLRVDDEARAAVQRESHLGGGVGKTVGSLFHEDHETVGVVGELEPRAHHPAVGVGVEAVVVVAVDLAQRVVVGLGLELDHAHASVVGAHRLDLGDDARARRRVAGEPAALVGTLVAGLPEPAAFELAVGSGDRREVGVAAALPVHVFEGEILRLGDRIGEVSQHHVAVLGERVDPRVERVQRDVGRPVRRGEPVVSDGHRSSVGSCLPPPGHR